ncbi:MAG: DinB family protein [Bryobacteraceae bacterium]
MPIMDAFLPEFDREMVIVRKHLERVPDGKFDFKPHPKSMALGRLASHLAELPSWAISALQLDSLDLAPPGGPPFKPAVLDTQAAVLALFDKNVAGARAEMAVVADEKLMQNWSLLMGGQTMMTMPRVALLRTWVLNHAIHHRAQLGVYLRLNDVPVPSTYGPSADEGKM